MIPDIGTAEEAAHGLSPERSYALGIEQLANRYPTAPAFIESAADRKHTEAQNLISKIRENREKQADIIKGAQRLIVILYLEGRGVDVNTAKAAELFLRYGDENVTLARVLHRMLGAEKDKSTSLRSTYGASAQTQIITERLSQLEAYITARPPVDLRQVQKDALTPQPL